MLRHILSPTALSLRSGRSCSQQVHRASHSIAPSLAYCHIPAMCAVIHHLRAAVRCAVCTRHARAAASEQLGTSAGLDAGVRRDTCPPLVKRALQPRVARAGAVTPVCGAGGAAGVPRGRRRRADPPAPRRHRRTRSRNRPPAGPLPPMSYSGPDTRHARALWPAGSRQRLDVIRLARAGWRGTLSQLRRREWTLRPCWGLTRMWDSGWWRAQCNARCDAMRTAMPRRCETRGPESRLGPIQGSTLRHVRGSTACEQGRAAAHGAGAGRGNRGTPRCAAVMRTGAA